jgi:hypothetical protein
LTYIAALRRWIRSFQLRCWDFGDPDTALMLMDSSHLSNQPLIVRVLRRVRDRTNKIREVVMMMMMMMMMMIMIMIKMVMMMEYR